MKSFFLLVFISLGASISAQERGFKPVSKEKPELLNSLYDANHALIIGNSNYINGWPELPGVDEDIKAIEIILDKSGFNTLIARNLNKYQIDSAITSFISTYGTGPESGLLFYFAGHGHTITTNYGEKLGYIVPTDAPNPTTSAMDFQSKAVEMAQMEIYAKRIESKHALFVFDACFSGSLFGATRAIPEVITYKTTQPVRQFITSGTEDEEVSDESIFRKQFVEALATSNADFDKDGFLTGTELGRFLQSTVISYSNNTQHPQYGKISNPSLNKGDFVFVLDSASVQNQSWIESGSSDDPDFPRGTIELITEIGGDLYLNGSLLSSISANSIVPILDLPVGIHSIQIIGKERWNDEIEVVSNETTSLKIVSQISDEFNSPFIQLTFIQGGTYEMGTRYGEKDEQPVHQITVNDFEMSTSEVTVSQFRKFIEQTGYRTESEVEGWSWYYDDSWKKKYNLTWEMNSNGEKAGDLDPVVYVSWNDCQAFIQWMNKKYDDNYRLPTEAEWEYASRGGIHKSDLDFSGGVKADDVGWFKTNSGNTGHQVKQKKANALNLYDMSGNVWEWCQDWYNERYYERSTYSNPKGPLSGEYRVLRGGSWVNNEESGRVTNRHKYRPMDRDNLTGFRIVREIY